ncbi:MAG: hypothetical protein A2571_01785 [Candidatus Vogelbacteria bacterium RIFOXYD1_FULL_44_32]|uniref:Vitamin K epoxide reductase domain-containing protein n=1 Tax=Candidatus Vogelbacteria bacterium RIFOXYD1_FULL_44_32 TaxID=1802438 RepID=A0A1G2QEI8_9BACT|nr:MAG: hypothetical protein A2571_01785 [Candidatus Vogelbacteria bacterium RIFOXYD1_FULL_44_32]
MPNSNLKQKFSGISRVQLFITTLVFSLVGILDTSYLLAEKILGGTVKCIAVKGCDTVLQSSYSTLFGFVPASLAGFIFYIAVFILAFYLWSKGGKVQRGENILLVLAVLGLLFSGWFFYVQAVILQAFCTYCLISAFNTVLIFGSIFWLRFKS